MTVVDDVKARLDILELVSGYATLQRSGSSFKANCPFHQERTPSFYVFPDRQSWRCFGACATGGDVFSFVMRAENLEFGEALRRLAQQVGVALPSQERRAEQQERLQINEVAARFFQQRLTSAQGADTRDYLDQRDISRDSIEKFELGLSPGDGQSLGQRLAREGFPPEQSAQAGLVRAGDEGGHRDLFRGRLMIPIRDGQGELVGFGSRALDDSVPKYLNSPRTPLFDKGRILYALYLAREAIGHRGMVIVEGYMDAIMAHQHGFDNVVASMGTALTEQQVSQVRRLTSDVTMALDPDMAGQQATLRSLESSWQVFQRRAVARSQGTTLFQPGQTTQLKVAALPDGLDPDELIRRSPAEWPRLIEQGVPLLDYLFAALSAQMDLNSSQGKTRMVELLFPLIAAVPEPTEQDRYFQRLAEQLDVRPETLLASVVRPRAMQTRRGPAQARPEVSQSAFESSDHEPVEEYYLALLLQHPELWGEVAELPTDFFRRQENRAIFSQLSDLHGSQGDLFSTELVCETIAPELEEQLQILLQKSLPPSDHQQRVAGLQDTFHRLEERNLKDSKILEERALKDSNKDEENDSAGGSLDFLEDFYLEALELNQRIRINEGSRNRLARNPAHGR
jgi:DNA primase